MEVRVCVRVSPFTLEVWTTTRRTSGVSPCDRGEGWSGVGIPRHLCVVCPLGLRGVDFTRRIERREWVGFEGYRDRAHGRSK